MSAVAAGAAFGYGHGRAAADGAAVQADIAASGALATEGARAEAPLVTRPLL